MTIVAGGGVQEVLRAARLELRLCRALVALSPPRDVSLLVRRGRHSRR
jgi:hypothetical protein